MVSNLSTVFRALNIVYFFKIKFVWGPYNENIIHTLLFQFSRFTHLKIKYHISMEWRLQFESIFIRKVFKSCVQSFDSKTYF